MVRVQIVYASRHGGNAGIAERIGEVLRSEGLEVTVAEAAAAGDPAGFDAFVIGSGVYVGSWLADAVDYLERAQSTLAGKPVWLFSSGPVAAPPADPAEALESALGPSEGPGSGGHRRIDAFSAVIHPREHRVFGGAFNPSDPPKSLQERIVRLLPAAKAALPAGDFRDWDAIDGWAHKIAKELAPVAVG
jgi:menaquinone-dependent protoporphyrinogen oxidase